MKKLNQGLSLVMMLLLCMASFNSSLISNAEETNEPSKATVIGDKLFEENDTTEPLTVEKNNEKELQSDGLNDTDELDEQGEEDDDDETEPIESKKDSLKENTTEEENSSESTEETDDTVASEDTLDEETELTEGTVEKADSTDAAIEETAETVKEEVVEEETLKEDAEEEEAVDEITVTFKVENGSWEDGTSDEKVVTLTEQNDFKLTADQIPAVGNNPCDNTYRAGSWDVTPSEDVELTESVTYTYTYEKKQAAVVTKAPEAKELFYIMEAQ